MLSIKTNKKVLILANFLTDPSTKIINCQMCPTLMNIHWQIKLMWLV